MMGVIPKEEQEAPSLPMERETPAVMMEGEREPPPPPPPETLAAENARLRARVAALEALVERSGLGLPARSEEATPQGAVQGVVVLSVADESSQLTDWELRKWAERWCGGDREGLPHISTWNTSRVSDFSKLFENQRVFNDDISAWDTSNVGTMEKMFMGASSFNQPLNDWRVDNVTTRDGP